MPRSQSYKNHSYFPLPTVVSSLLASVALLFLFLAIRDSRTISLTDWALVFLTGSVFMLNAMSRSYTTKLQDRIIRLEMRVRLKDVLPPARHAEIDRLTMDQLIALRFASDAELPALVHRAVTERLTRDQIKREIAQWMGDYLRT